jgi:transcriptional regulator with XRE-family HTH domain
MSHFSERLNEALSKSGLSKSAFAKALGVSYQAVAQALSGGTRALTASNNQKAASILGVSAEWLATGTGPKQVHGHGLGQLLAEETALLELLRALPPEVRHRAIESVHQIAAEYSGKVSLLLSRSVA